MGRKYEEMSHFWKTKHVGNLNFDPVMYHHIPHCYMLIMYIGYTTRVHEAV